MPSEFSGANQLRLSSDVELAPLTTMEVGGRAAHYVSVSEPIDLISALRWAREKGMPVEVLGGGSNVLVSDRGFDGLVVHVCSKELRVLGSEDSRVRVRVGAGVLLDDLVRRSVEEGWAGLECLAGIPGTVGATPVQNVGAYGQEVSESLVEVCAVDRATLEPVRIDRGACAFAYRSSVFKGRSKNRFLIHAVTFALDKGGRPTVRYPELERKLDGSTSSLQDVRNAVLELRRAKSMVYDAADENRRSVGSFFLNPIVSTELAREVARRGSGKMPSFPVEAGVKLSAAWLVERAGFAKGAGDGRVGISSRHALSIVNRGGATAAEVIAFARKVREAVRSRFAVVLSPEPVLLGFSHGERTWDESP